VRRAHNVEAAWLGVLDTARKRREEWLHLVRLRLGVLQALAGDWSVLATHLSDEEQLAILQRLADELRPALRAPVAMTTSQRVLRHALAELVESLARFNERWRTYLDGVDLSDVNRLRADYNRFYVLEKECVVRSPVIARQGFRPLPPASRADVEAALPLLGVPRPGASHPQRAPGV
jgi:hypothetical protein